MGIQSPAIVDDDCAVSIQRLDVTTLSPALQDMGYRQRSFEPE